MNILQLKILKQLFYCAFPSSSKNIWFHWKILRIKKTSNFFVLWNPFYLESYFADFKKNRIESLSSIVSVFQRESEKNVLDNKILTISTSSFQTQFLKTQFNNVKTFCSTKQSNTLYTFENLKRLNPIDMKNFIQYCLSKYVNYNMYNWENSLKQ